MRIGIFSDIHLHRPGQAGLVSRMLVELEHKPLDLLVCAGDISHRTGDVASFLQAMQPACPRVWVPGNHDVWAVEPEHADDSARDRYERVFPALSRQAGWHYLPAGPLALEGRRLAVVGSLGWFAGAGYSEWFDREASWADDVLAREFAGHLRRDLTAVGDARVLLVTHHPGHAGCPLEMRGRHAGWNPYVQAVIAEQPERVALAVHGHRHCRYGPLVLDGVGFVGHPLGYGGDGEVVRVLELGET